MVGAGEAAGCRVGRRLTALQAREFVMDARFGGQMRRS